MASAGDRRAARVLLGLAVAGAVARGLGHAGEGAPGGIAFRAARELARPARDSVEAQAERAARPLRRGERIDPNRAGAVELARLPRIGPALAARIVRYRDSSGPRAFRTLEDLERVPGIGPGVVRTITPHVTLRPGGRRGRDAPARPVALNRASAEELATLPGIGPSRARAIVEDRSARGPFRRLEDLTRIRGIGPGTVERLRGRVRVP